MTYYLKSEKKLTKTVFPLRLHTTVHHTQNNLHQNSFPERSFKIQQEQIANSHTNNVLNKSIDIPTPEQHTTSTYTTSSHSGTHTPLSSRISNIIQTTQSPWIRTLLVFVLGLLLSLTPCIYPMIPITAGILQTQGGSSVLRNILLSSSYTLGLAITFSLLGMLATFTGNFFGAFLGHPIIIISFTLLLLYLAGSMLGLYTMYIPPFMKPKQKNIWWLTMFCFLFWCRKWNDRIAMRFSGSYCYIKFSCATWLALFRFYTIICFWHWTEYAVDDNWFLLWIIKYFATDRPLDA